MKNFFTNHKFWVFVAFAIIWLPFAMLFDNCVCARIANAGSGSTPIRVYVKNLNSNKQVYRIDVTENSYYIIDARFDSCFYETITINGVAVVYIPCYRFEELIKGMSKNNKD